jgi:hypothetical protein
MIEPIRLSGFRPEALVQRALSSVVIALVMLAAALSAQSAQPAQQPRSSGPTMSIAARNITPEILTGSWDYNDALSLDAATGRPERAPRSATQRPGTAPAPSSGGRTSGGGPVGGGGMGGGERGGGGFSDNFDQARRAMQAVIAAERRTYVRDLLEVPERLTIKATPQEVVIVDDLARSRTYTTDGRAHKYQLSAARFEARSTWTDTYFRKDIQGANNFKMTETYFVSEDSRRLFVIIRIGDPKRPETMAGVNRVYDRIDPSLPQ